MLKNNSNNKLSLEKQIAAGRQKLQKLYDSHGRTDAAVLAAGVELDELLNKYQRLKSPK